MKFRRTGLLFLFLAPTATWAQTNPLPFLNQPLSPSSTLPGGPSFTLTVHGAGFVNGATVNWNGHALVTAFVSVDELTATVPASNIAAASSAAVTVTNPTPGGGASNVVYFQVSALTNLQFSTSPSSTSLPTGQLPSSPPLVADFRHNGILDVMMVMRAFPTSALIVSGSMFLGNGDGSFQAAISAFPPTGGGIGPVIGDFNGDGIPDLVIADCPLLSLGVCQLGVWLGEGDGTFSQSATMTQFTSSGGLALGDFNGDGKLDIAVGTPTGITVLLGNGDSTLQSGVLSNMSNVGGPFTAGDFDGDGKLDLVGITATGSPTVSISFFHGNGDGTFTASSTSYPLALFVNQILAADLKGDGKLDLIILLSQNSSNPSAEIAVMLGNGDGTFKPAVTYSVDAGGGTLALGDFSSSGKLDLAFPNQTNTLILPGNGDGTFNLAGVVTVPIPSLYLAAGDLNSDGKLDLALAYQQNYIPSATFLLQDAPLVGLSPSTLTFAAQALGSSSPSQSVTLKNNGTGTVNLSNVTFTGTNPSDFSQTNNCPTSLTVGATCQINVSFAPTANGSRNASLSLTDNVPGTPQSVLLSGSGGLAVVQLSVPALGFGNEPVGNTSAGQSITVSNTGFSPVNFSSISVGGSNVGDFGQTNTCGSSLAPSGTCTISVTFTPTALGNRTASVTIADDAPGSPQTVGLTGSGITTIAFSPATVTFANQFVGTSGLPQSVTITNNGVSPVTISSITTSPSDFGSLNACGNSVAPGASCSVGVFFDPATSGARNGTLTITDSAPGSPQTLALTGMGQDFSMNSSSSSATVTSGQTANYTVTIAPAGGFNQKVALSCTGAPALSTCSVSPGSVVLNGSTAASIMVSVSTGGSPATVLRPFGIPPVVFSARLFLSVAALLTCAWLYFLLLPRRRPTWLLRGASLALLLLFLTALSSCGGNGGSRGGGTPSGTYTLTVTGAFNSGSSTLTHNATLTLVVQ
jgi:hypothetical protein